MDMAGTRPPRAPVAAAVGDVEHEVRREDAHLVPRLRRHLCQVRRVAKDSVVEGGAREGGDARVHAVLRLQEGDLLAAALQPLEERLLVVLLGRNLREEARRAAGSCSVARQMTALLPFSHHSTSEKTVAGSCFGSPTRMRRRQAYLRAHVVDMSWTCPGRQCSRQREGGT